MAIYEYQQRRPLISPDAFIFENAVIIGNVKIDNDVSIWSAVTIRGDNDAITIGEGSNVQEGSVLHVDQENPLTIGRNVTVGHQAMLHGCAIGDGSLVGIGAVVLNGAIIGRNCLIGAGAIIPEGRKIPDGSLVIGIGKVLRKLDVDEIAGIHAGTANYVEKARTYRKDLRRIV